MVTTRRHPPILVIRPDGNGYCRTCGLPVGGTDHRNIWHIRTQAHQEAPKMMPGQEPYTPAEMAVLGDLVADAAAGDPGEAGEDDVLDQLAESGLTPEVVEKMREGRYLTANRCPICKVGRGRWCRGLTTGKVHADRLDNIEES